MRILFINRHDLVWATGPRGSYLPCRPEDRHLITRDFGGGLNGWSQEYFPNTLVCDMNEPKALEARIRSAIYERSRERFPERIITIHEKDMLLAARLRAELGLEGMTPSETLRFRDKLAMKQALIDGGYSAVPKFRSLTSVRSLQDLPWTGTSVIKNRWGQGASQVREVASDEQVADAVVSLGGNVADLQIEEYIDSPMFHCDSIVVQGRIIFAVASEYLAPPGKYLETPVHGTVPLPAGQEQDQLLQHNAAVLGILGMTSGVAHVEFFRSNTGKIVFCEAAARPGGAGINRTLQSTYGINLVRAAVRIQAGSLPRSVKLRDQSSQVFGMVGVTQGAAPFDLRHVLAETLKHPFDYEFTPPFGDGVIRHSTDFGHKLFIHAPSRDMLWKDVKRLSAAVGAIVDSTGNNLE